MTVRQLAPDTAEWSVWSTTARVVVTDPQALDAAVTIVEEQLAAVDAAASRFRDDSELSRLDRVSGAPQRISALLADLIQAGLDAARQTDGDVDPTLGAALQEIGYDRDFTQLATDPAAFAIGPASRSVTIALTSPAPEKAETVAKVVVHRPPSWRDVVLDGTTLTLPPGVTLDLGATAKAFTADRSARLAATQTGAGVLVSLGGDIATAGEGPPDGWQIRVSDGDGEPESSISLPSGAAIATSSTIRRAWAQDGRLMHHILDPRSGLPVAPVWRTVTVAAPSCLVANTLSTAAIVRGATARAWLDGAGVTARFVTAAGEAVRVGGWPRD